MKKMVLTALVLALSAPAMANDAVKLNFVKKLYRERLAVGDGAGGVYDLNIIGKYGNSELKRLVRAHPSNELCHDWDSMTAWGSGYDGPEAKGFTYSMGKNGRVRVAYRFMGKKQVSEFELSCNGNHCVIQNIYLNGSSKKDGVKADLEFCATAK